MSLGGSTKTAMVSILWFYASWLYSLAQCVGLVQVCVE